MPPDSGPKPLLLTVIVPDQRHFPRLSTPNHRISTGGFRLSGRSWRVAYRAAFEYPTRERLPLLTRPTLLATSAVDPLRVYSGEAARISDVITVAESEGYVTPGASRRTAELYRAFFDRQEG